MQTAPTVGIDLPLKALAWEDEAGGTWLAYNAPEYIVKRHGLDPSLGANLAAAVPLMEAATQ